MPVVCDGGCDGIRNGGRTFEVVTVAGRVIDGREGDRERGREGVITAVG